MLFRSMDELEFCRCAVFRGPGVNILLTSSEFMLLLLHPKLVLGWKELRAGATAVIGGVKCVNSEGSHVAGGLSGCMV